MAHGYLARTQMRETEFTSASQHVGRDMLARGRVLTGLMLLLVLATGCMGRATPADDSPNVPQAGPAAPGPLQTREPYPISGVPHCPGLAELPSPLQFDWPNMDEALEKLEAYNWGYFACAMPQAELQSFVRQNMPKPPYLWEEVNGTENQGGAVFVFYHNVYVTWIYIWMLPQDDKQMSYMVIARGDPGEAQTWECRLRDPPVMARAGVQAIHPWPERKGAVAGSS
jgi:hypothetical protein